jgi:hypothetical protein
MRCRPASTTLKSRPCRLGWKNRTLAPHRAYKPGRSVYGRWEVNLRTGSPHRRRSSRIRRLGVELEEQAEARFRFEFPERLNSRQ